MQAISDSVALAVSHLLVAQRAFLDGTLARQKVAAEMAAIEDLRSLHTVGSPEWCALSTMVDARLHHCEELNGVMTELKDMMAVSLLC